MIDFAALAKWYATNGSHYPWRNTRDPYKVLMTEIMLQRTRADIVAKMFPTFFGRYPTLKALAKASSKEIAEMLTPLGLTHRIPRIVELTAAMSKMSGIPRDRDALLELPGVGPYIADAILCYSFGMPTVPIDVNIRRLLGRYYGGVDTKRHAEKALRSFLTRRKREMDIRKLNWAFLDLAKTVCMTNIPTCHECPLAVGCKYARSRN
jgi:A/G-specific adenine glycosylase